MKEEKYGMPRVRLVDKTALQRLKRQGSERSRKDREVARQLLCVAYTTGQALELTLEENERAETVKLRYRTIAEEAHLKLRFYTLQRRIIQNRAGMKKEEAVMLMVVVRSSQI